MRPDHFQQFVIRAARRIHLVVVLAAIECHALINESLIPKRLQQKDQ
jgi:hypothetical protein